MELFNSVHCRVRRALQPKVTRKKDTILGEENEDILVQLIQHFGNFKNPLTKAMVIEIATGMAGLEKLLTTGWLDSFVKRHQNEISLGKGRLSHKKKSY